jgi:hypothetical protein
VGADPVRIAIGGGYRTAAEMLFDVNAGLAVAYEHFTSRLDGFGGMAGTDGPGEQFARAYDDAANAALWAYSDIVAAAGNLASIASASAANHDRANRASIIVPGGYMYDPEAPLREGRAAKVWRHEVPSALGSDGWGPDWWHFVADAVGYLYPDASTGDLERAAGEWTWQATVLEEYASSCAYAISCLREQISPEIDDAVAACTLLREQLEALAGSFRQVGQLCQEYADQVEHTRDAIADAAKELLAWTVGTQIASHGLALFTAGGSELLGQSFQATRIAAAAAKIRTILSELALWVTTKLGPLNAVKTSALASSARVEKLIGLEAVFLGRLPATSRARLPALICPKRQLQSHFDHAPVLGVMGNYNKARALEYETRLGEFVADPATLRFMGKYKGKPAVLNFDPESRIVVIQDPRGVFVSVWRAESDQYKNLIVRGSL